jgi:hypothetical protein
VRCFTSILLRSGGALAAASAAISPAAGTGQRAISEAGAGAAARSSSGTMRASGLLFIGGRILRSTPGSHDGRQKAFRKTR